MKLLQLTLLSSAILMTTAATSTTVQANEMVAQTGNVVNVSFMNPQRCTPLLTG